jgi:DNA mismatch repair protein MutL
MGKIKILSIQEAQKIAAGEVVERPANIVKELIENALDAGATAVTLFVEEGGKKLIRLIDNGCGMSEEDARLCILPHATSKINTIEELAALTTFGFRGEALASISAVSTIKLQTQEEGATSGTELIVECGKLIYATKRAGNWGTEITISHLFDNIPVRKKFLKSRETEWRALLQIFQAFCSAYPTVHFMLMHDGHQIYNCLPAKTLQERVIDLFGNNLVSDLIIVEKDTELSEYTIDGLITSSLYQRYDRSQIFFFVNRRWIKNYKLTQALLKGYGNSLVGGKYPAAFIFITLDPALIDVNIHPRKEEVQFLHPRKIEMSLEKIINKALNHTIGSHLQAATLQMPSQSFSREPVNFFSSTSSIIHPVFEQHFQKIETPRVHSPEQSVIQKADFLSVIFQQETLQEIKEFHIIGQLQRTYIMLESNGLLLVDQHAAHERILYELFAHRFEEVALMPLLFPLTLNFSEPDYQAFIQYQALFEEHGISSTLLDMNQIAITTLPVPLQNVDLEGLIKTTLLVLQHSSTHDIKVLLHTTLHTQMACKAAVKAGDVLSYEHMQELIQNLMKTENHATCPHGRPTLWNISTFEIEKKFKRT